MEYYRLSGIVAPIVTVLIAFSAYGLGIAVIRSLDTSATLLALERIILAGLIGAVIMAGSIWLVGAIRYDGATMAAVLAVSLALAFLFAYRSSESFAETIIAFRAALPTGAWSLITWSIVIIVLVGIIGSYATPSDHDTIRYHLYLPDRDLLRGRIGVEFGRNIYEFFPPLSAMLTRMAFALGGPVGAQLLNLVWQIVAAGTAAALTYRLSRRTDIAWLAALFLLGQRVSINLASAVSVEFVLAAYAGGIILVILALMRRPDMLMGVLLGLVVGGLVNVKHQGFVFAACIYLPMVLISLRHKKFRNPLIVSMVIAFVLLLPWLVRNYVVTGNPLFPAFHHLLSEDNINLFEKILTLNKTDLDFLSFALIPWTIFVDQGKFDEFQFGIPFLLVFFPFVFVSRSRRHLFLLMTIIAAYLVAWFVLMPHYIRFLVPLFPILCAGAAIGAGVIGDGTGTVRWARRIIIFIVVGLGVAQAGFLGATASRRIPAALNMVSPEIYLETKPFKWYAQYNACRWVSDRLADGEAYLALLNNRTYYCRAARTFPDFLPGDEKTSYKKTPRPVPSPQWLGEQLLKCRVKYIIMAKNLGADSEPNVFAKHRYDGLISAAKVNVSPVFQTPVANVFDGPQVAKALLGLPPEVSSHPMFTMDGPEKDRQCAVSVF